MKYLINLLVTIFFSLTTTNAQELITLNYKGFSVIFNTQTHEPFYSFYTINQIKLSSLGTSGRLDCYARDNDFKGIQENFYEFIKTGYDKGHLTPAYDMSYEPETQTQSFFFTNIIPQNATLNRNAWAELENIVRKEAKYSDSLFIITGCCSYTGNRLKSAIDVPDSIFKIWYNYTTKIIRCYKVPNQAISNIFIYPCKSLFMGGKNFRNIIAEHIPMINK